MAALPQLEYEIGPIWSSERNTDVQLNAYVGNKHFQVELSAANLESSPKLLKEYLRHVERLAPDYLPPPTDDEFTDLMEDFYDWAMKPFLALFRQIPHLDPNQQYTLRDCLFQETLCFTLQSNEEDLVPLRHDIAMKGRPIGALLPDSAATTCSIFATYSPKDIYVPLDCSAVALPPISREAYINGQHLSFFKLVLPGDVNSTLRELSAYAKIHAAQLGANVNIPRLLGIVKDDATNRILGLLLSYIESKSTTLLCAGRGPENNLLRQKWIRQITQSLRELHAHGIVWGDAKPDNVLINQQNDAYLIDLGGGYTNGWVDQKLSNTIEGDLQGLERIVDYVSTELA